jgi:histidyl-tRNA synthetase
MGSVIEPKVLKGFRDALPAEESARRAILRRLEEVFRLHGFAPIDTPALEYADVLLGKGGGETDKQVYRFTDHGGRDVALRFDLTVPFARFMAAHIGELALPFRRWHAAKVWRGENTQRGRYREFMQVDFDVVGTEAESADLETLVVIRDSFRALEVGAFQVQYSHRGALNAALARMGVTGNAAEVLRIIDKERKIGEEKTRELLAEVVGGPAARDVMAFARREPSSAETMRKVADAAGPSAPGVQRLREIERALAEIGIAESFVLDPSITRGLDYYTGLVVETYLEQLPSIGSVCSGGRYDDLASLYSPQRLPGVGASIGVDRLLAAMEDLHLAPTGGAAPAVLVLNLADSLVGRYHAIAEALRGAGIPAEVYPEKRRLAAQFAYAEKRGIPLGVICGEEEQARGTVNLKDLRSRQSWDGLTLPEATARISAQLR